MAGQKGAQLKLWQNYSHFPNCTNLMISNWPKLLLKQSKSIQVTTNTADDTKILSLWLLTPWLLVVLTALAQCSHCNYADQAPYHLSLAPVSAVNVFTNSIFRFSTLRKYSATLLPQTPAFEGYTSSQGEDLKSEKYIKYFPAVNLSSLDWSDEDFHSASLLFWRENCPDAQSL